jgi:hypothetical protein
MTSSTKKAPGAGELTGRKLIVLGEYHGPGFVQTGMIWRRWEREAGRLFSLFWTTSDERHLRAFAEHVYAMRGFAGRRRS